MTVLAADIVTVQVVPLTESQPAQLAKAEPVTGTVVRITLPLKLYEQVVPVPQLIPAGLLVTIPVPVPALATVSG